MTPEERTELALGPGEDPQLCAAVARAIRDGIEEALRSAEGVVARMSVPVGDVRVALEELQRVRQRFTDRAWTAEDEAKHLEQLDIAIRSMGHPWKPGSKDWDWDK